ncbi:MAG: ABC transporter ATP-binding protein [Solirubrobacterales bacterium]
MDDILVLKNINKTFGQNIKTQVLFDINLSIKEHSFNSIIGQSGSGKSTLLNIMGTLDRPTSGEVFVAGSNTSEMTGSQLAELRNETIGFIFQFHYLLPEFTALENVIMPYLIKYDKPSKEILRRAEELMDIIGLSQVRNNLSINMSGGQQQRTAIARALIMNPKLVLADEPTGNLDSDTTEVIYETLRDINMRFNTTFIIITHDRKIAEKTDRIIEITDGRVNLDILR